MTNGRRLLVASVALNLILAAALGVLLARRGATRREIPLSASGWLHAPAQDGFRAIPSEPGSTILVGDSLTAEGPWGELLADVLNRGVKGDTVDGVSRRLDEIVSRRPGRLFVQIGINDLLRGASTTAVVEGVESLVESARRTSPDTRLYILSLLPVAAGPLFDEQYSDALNVSVRNVNRQLAESAKRLAFTFVDLHAPMCDRDGRLRAELTYDGLHLTAGGYLVWKRVIARQER